MYGKSRIAGHVKRLCKRMIHEPSEEKHYPSDWDKSAMMPVNRFSLCVRAPPPVFFPFFFSLQVLYL